MILLPSLLLLLIQANGFQAAPRPESGAAVAMAPFEAALAPADHAADAAEAAAAATRGAREEPFTCARDGSMPEIKTCAGDDLEREKARMQRYLEAAAVRALENDEESVKYGPRTRQAALLSESQRAWQAYVDSHCAVWLPDGSGGTIGGLFYAECVTQATRQRTHDIWGDYLTFMSDSTPPVLPEPVRTIGEDRAEAGLN